MVHNKIINEFNVIGVGGVSVSVKISQNAIYRGTSMYALRAWPKIVVSKFHSIILNSCCDSRL